MIVFCKVILGNLIAHLKGDIQQQQKKIGQTRKVSEPKSGGETVINTTSSVRKNKSHLSDFSTSVSLHGARKRIAHSLRTFDLFFEIDQV